MKKGQLIKGKTPLAVLEVVCSWELTPKEIGAELHADMDLIYRATHLLRRKGYIRDEWPRKHHRPIVPTQAGREAVTIYSRGR